MIKGVELTAGQGAFGAMPDSVGRPREKLLLTLEEAAEVLSIGRTKVYELIARGALRSVSIDRSRRLPASALTEFVHGLEEQIAQPPRED